MKHVRIGVNLTNVFEDSRRRFSCSCLGFDARQSFITVPLELKIFASLKPRNVINILHTSFSQAVLKVTEPRFFRLDLRHDIHGPRASGVTRLVSAIFIVSSPSEECFCCQILQN